MFLKNILYFLLIIQKIVLSLHCKVEFAKRRLDRLEDYNISGGKV